MSPIVRMNGINNVSTFNISTLTKFGSNFNSLRAMALDAVLLNSNLIYNAYLIIFISINFTIPFFSEFDSLPCSNEQFKDYIKAVQGVAKWKECELILHQRSEKRDSQAQIEKAVGLLLV